MEFAICPSCKQSVLDDDAVDCPFCGASMKAKPGAAKPAAKPAAIATPAKAAASTGPATKPAARAKSAEDAPFDFSDNVSTTAVPASATRTKSRPLPVKCPMCETTGYVPADAAGKAVKCANPKCLVPVFTAPKPEPVKAPEPPPKPKAKRSILVVGGVTALIMIAGGIVAWMIAGMPEQTTTHQPTAEELELIKQLSQSNNGEKPATKTDVAQTPTKDAVEPKAQTSDPPTTVTATAAWLKLMNDTSLQQRQNRSKPYCRQQSAEAFALTGDLEGARNQLSALAQVGSEVPYYAVTPLVEIAWRQLAANDRAGAKQTIEEAWVASARLPQTGRDRLQKVIVLAAALIAVDRDADAKKLLTAHEGPQDIARLAQRLRAVLSLGTFDLAEMDQRRPAMRVQYPLAVGVIYELTARNQSGVQSRWIGSLNNPRMQAEVTAAHLDAVAWRQFLQGEPLSVEPMLAEAAALPSPGNLLAVSRLGIAAHLAGNEAAAQTCLAKANEFFATLMTPAEIVLPDDLKELSKFEPAEVAQSEFRAAAIAEAAALAAKLGQTETAETLLTAALANCRAVAPGLYDVEQRNAEIKSNGIPALRARLKEEWNLKTDNEAQVAATTLQKNLDQLVEAANRRIELQTQLLTQAVGWGLPDFVWNYIRRGSTTEDARRADYLLFTNLPGMLAEKFQSDGNSEQAEVVATAWKQLSGEKPMGKAFASDLASTLTSADAAGVARAAAMLKAFSGKSDELDDAVLPAICRVATSGQADAALKLASSLKDPVLREECDLLIAGIAARRGETAAVEKRLDEFVQATEKIAALRGLIGGRVSGEAAR